jgi:adenosylmethionine-8-amino-7-oxononanoate aminotransferase
MNDFIILGTDTDAGKTTFALLWLQLFADRYEYWKPIETGESDSDTIARLVPGATVHPPLRRFREPVAPPLAAKMERATIPSARLVVGAMPRALNENKALLIETFGGPFSPLNDDELQLSLIKGIHRPGVLVTSTRLGCIGRTLQTCTALRSQGIALGAIVLLGPRDRYAEEVIQQHAAVPAIALEPPDEWTTPALRACVERQRSELERLHEMWGKLPACRDIGDDDRRTVWHPYTPLLGADEPLPCVGAVDEFLELADGRKVIDAISSWWTILFGHRHPPLMQALAEASQRIDHVLFAGVTHPYAVELADLLLGTMPWQGGRVFYSDNGSTAVEVALKMAYQYWCHRDQPQRTRFVGFEHGYHGDTFGAMAVSRDPLFFGRFEPLLFQADIVPLDPGELAKHLSKHAQQIAAMIVEPLVQGAGGMVMHSPETLRAIADVAREHDVLFIADEVMTGGGRTGTLWAHQAAGVVPDLICAAKTMTGGVLPLAATLVAPKNVEAFLSADRTRTFFHGHSFTANPLACAVAVSCVRELLKHSMPAKRIEDFWTQALTPLRGSSIVKDVRIRGSIAAVEIEASGGYLADVGKRMKQTCLDRGVFLRPLGNVLYAMPPYCTSTQSLQRIADAMIAAVQNA